MREQGVRSMVSRLWWVFCCCPTVKWLTCFLVDMCTGMQWILPPLIPWLLLVGTVGFVGCIIPLIDQAMVISCHPGLRSTSPERSRRFLLAVEEICSFVKIRLLEPKAFYHLTDFYCTKSIAVLQTEWSKQYYIGCRVSNLSHITLPYASSKKVHFHIAIAMDKINLVFFKMVDTEPFMKWTWISSSPTCSNYEMVEPNCGTKPKVCQAKTWQSKRPRGFWPPSSTHVHNPCC